MKTCLKIVFCLLCFLVATLLSAVAQARVVSKTVIHEHHHTHIHRTPVVVAVPAPSLAYTVISPPSASQIQTSPLLSSPIIVYSARTPIQPGTVTVDPSAKVTRSDMRRAGKLAKHGHNVQIN